MNFPQSRPTLAPAWPYPKVIAHRGGGTLAPENTLAGMRCGREHGFHAVEFDVMLAQDEIPVVIHDPVLGRTVKGSGKISDLSAQQLVQLDAGTWFDAAYAGEPVPTYEQIFRFCMSNEIWMNVEIKPAPGFEEATGQRVAQLTREWLAAAPGTGILAPLFSSFSFEALVAAKAAAPEIARGFLVDRIGPDWRQKLDVLGAVALHTNQKHLSRQQACTVKDAGFGLFCYTVNNPARARELLAWGVDAFCTDRIDIIGADFC